MKGRRRCDGRLGWEIGTGRKEYCVTKLGRLYETDLISVSGEPSETRFQLAAPLAGFSKDQQPHTESNHSHLVGVIFEAHFWEE